MVGSRIYIESQPLHMILPPREEKKQQGEKEDSQTEDTTSDIWKKGGKRSPTSPRSRDGSEVLLVAGVPGNMTEAS